MLPVEAGKWLSRAIPDTSHKITSATLADSSAQDAALVAFVTRLIPSHLDDRRSDKLAIILGDAREALLAHGTSGHGVNFGCLSHLPKDVLLALVATVRCGDKAAALPRIGEQMGRLLAARLVIGDAASVEIAEMISLFEPLIGNVPIVAGPRSYRLW